MLGVFPMDFSAPNPYKKSKNTNNITQKLSLAKCLYPEICLLDLRKEYNRGIKGIGIVFNLDPHYKDGSHWVAMYIRMHNIESPGIYYFDSYGYKTPPLIAKFMRALKLQVPGAHLAYNARRFQYSETECGMYSIYFIVSMMKNISFKHFCKQPVRDPEMIHLRKIVFSK